MNDVEAVIFDADGTLFDTFEMIVSAYRHVSETHGLSIPEPAEIRARLGSPIRDMFAAFYPGQDLESLFKTNDDFVSANALQSEAFEGVKELLEALQRKNIKLGILTSGNSNILHILSQHDLKEYFSSVVYTERISNPKPHPEGFLLACQECEVAPAKSIMVGDTVYDIETGKNAGALATIAITHGFGSPEDLAAAKPDYTVQSIFELQRILLEA